MYECRPAILSICIELCSEAISKVGNLGYLPFHHLMTQQLSSERQELRIDLILLKMMETYPEALHVRIPLSGGDLPIHTECTFRYSPAILFAFIELCPETLAVACADNDLPLHRLLQN
jgi:hypothetical protein